MRVPVAVSDDRAALERAEEFADRGINISQIGHELRMVTAGARISGVCRHRVAARLTGSAETLTPICPVCAEDRRIDRQIANQRAAVAAMRRRIASQS